MKTLRVSALYSLGILAALAYAERDPGVFVPFTFVLLVLLVWEGATEK